MLIQERFLGPIRNWLHGPAADARARVFAGTYIGFLVERLIRGEALEGREREVYIDLVAASLERLIALPDVAPDQAPSEGPQPATKT